MSYCNVDDVLHATGFDRDRIQKLSPTTPTAASVNTLVQEFIDDAQTEIRERLRINSTINKELHLCTGEDDVFELGPEDQPESFTEYTVINNLVECFNLYLGGDCPNLKRLRPYPTDCELGTDSATPLVDWGDSTATIASSLTRKAGSYSVMATFANVAQYARYPDIGIDEWIDEEIDTFKFMAFYVRSSSDNTAITVRLYNTAGAYNYASYTIVKKQHWYLVMLDLDDDFTGTLDWENDHLMYIDFWVDKACYLLIDNMNFNDLWMFTAPAGEVALMRRSSEDSHESGYPFYVSYSFDPYLASVPRNIKKACACLAGVDLIDFMRGIRSEDVEFDAQAESGVSVFSKDHLTVQRESLLKKYEEALNATGFGYEFGPIDA
jgi:hypothetical protein